MQMIERRGEYTCLLVGSARVREQSSCERVSLKIVRSLRALCAEIYIHSFVCSNWRRVPSSYAPDRFVFHELARSLGRHQ